MCSTQLERLITSFPNNKVEFVKEDDHYIIYVDDNKTRVRIKKSFISEMSDDDFDMFCAEIESVLML